MKKLPKITIVTPSYNQVDFIERTIESILKQDYPNLQYIVMDGGSKDGTVEILKKYGDKITWKSEKDSGQSEAINKGLRLAKGEIVAFLNSDDTYTPGTLYAVAEYFDSHPKTKWAYGKCFIVDKHDKEIRRPITLYKNLLLSKFSYSKLLSENFISQPATFWRREIHDEFGYFDEEDHWCMDYEFWLRIGAKYPAGVINRYLANFRYHLDSKSGQEDKTKFQEEFVLAKKYSDGKKWPLILHKINYYKITWSYKIMTLGQRKLK
ncbi:glycosyltransferase [Candidatus Nomurabacteria bacterium]|nr:glycosyltransferase [Candidatus Nomurabacteria bacterium]